MTKQKKITSRGEKTYRSWLGEFEGYCQCSHTEIGGLIILLSLALVVTFLMTVSLALRLTNLEDRLKYYEYEQRTQWEQIIRANL